MKKIIVFLIVLFAISLNCADKKVINISSIDLPPYTNKNWSGFHDLVIKEMFNRIDSKANLLYIPATERAMLNANAGIDDGTYSRIKGLDSIYRNLIRVKEPILENWELFIFSKKTRFEVMGWKSINPYSVGYIKGWKSIELNIDNPKSILTASGDKNLFDLLLNDRVEIIIYEKYQGLQLMKDHGIKGVVVIDKPIFSSAMYMYLNKKHTSIVPKLEQALKEMKKDGTYNKIKKETLPE